MKRWHLTFGLTVVALGAAWIAPRLVARTQQEVLPPSETPEVRVSEIVTTPPVVEVVAEPPQGRLVVDAGLDRTAMLVGQTAERYVTVTVTAPEGEGGRAVRRPVDLGVVMDTSGSMAAQGKIDQARRAAKVLAHEMGPTDIYSLTVFNDFASVAIPAGRVTDASTISLAVDRIFEGGGTNLYAGMETGAGELKRIHRDEASARVVILSDGIANIGIVDDEALVRYAAGLAADGFAVSTIGLGLEFNEDLLAKLADVGGGSYHFVDDASQLERVFSDELDRTATVMAHSTNLALRLADGVTPIEVVGWDARAVGTGWDVYLGDVFAGETKKIVVKVRIDPARFDLGADALVLDAAASYLDVTAQADDRSWDRATVTVTDDPAAVAGSLDRTRAIEATRAVGSKFLDLSTRAWASEDYDQSVKLAEEGTRLLREQAAALGDASLREDAESLDAARDSFQMHTPSSTEGRTLIKTNKERFRALAR